MAGQLTNKDHDDLDVLLGHLFDDHKAGLLAKTQAVGAVTHIVAALDIGNLGEVQTWLRHGRRLARESAA